MFLKGPNLQIVNFVVKIRKLGDVRVVDGLSGEAKKAETVEDRGLEATHLCKTGVNVKRATTVS